jgi:hypothetical protein
MFASDNVHAPGGIRTRNPSKPATTAIGSIVSLFIIALLCTSRSKKEVYGCTDSVQLI